MTVPSHPESLAIRGYIGLNDEMMAGLVVDDPV